MFVTTFRVLVVAAYLFSLTQFSPQLAAQPVPVSPQDNTARQQEMSQNNGQQKRTFAGRIVKSGDKLVLYDKSKETSYQLNDQQLARLFQGQEVKVTGSLDSKSNTIAIFSVAVPKENRSS